MAYNSDRIRASMDGAANAYDGVGNFNDQGFGKFLTSMNNRNDQEDQQRLQQPNQEADTLVVEDGDTIVDTLTGKIHRMEGYDTAENHDSSNKFKKLRDEYGLSSEEQLSASQGGTDLLQSMVDDGTITRSKLDRGFVGSGYYGRTLTRMDNVTDSMVSQGLAAPTNKFDETRQKMYREYQQKQFDLYGETDNTLESIRSFNNSRQDQDALGYVGNLGKKVGASVVGAGAEMLDFLADATVGQAKGALGYDDNTDWFGDYAHREKVQSKFGVDMRHSNYAREDMYLDWNTGNKTRAVLTGVTESFDVLAESSGDIATTFVPFLGAASKLDKGAKLLSLARATNALKSSAGVLATAGSRANISLEQRAEITGEDADISTVLGVYAAQVPLVAIDKLSFGHSAGVAGGAMRDGLAVRNLVRATGALVDESSMLKTVASTVYGASKKTASIGVAAGLEAAQEIIQTSGELLAVHYGTDEFGTDISKLWNNEKYIKELTIAGLLGAGAGGGMTITGTAVGHVASTGRSIMEGNAERQARNDTITQLQYASANDRALFEQSVNNDIEVANASINNYSTTYEALQNYVKEDGTFDWETINKDASSDLSNINGTGVEIAMASTRLAILDDIGTDNSKASVLNKNLNDQYHKRIKNAVTEADPEVRNKAVVDIINEVQTFTNSKAVKAEIKEQGGDTMHPVSTLVNEINTMLNSTDGNVDKNAELTRYVSQLDALMESSVDGVEAGSKVFDVSNVAVAYAFHAVRGTEGMSIKTSKSPTDMATNIIYNSVKKENEVIKRLGRVQSLLKDKSKVEELPSNAIQLNNENLDKVTTAIKDRLSKTTDTSSEDYRADVAKLANIEDIKNARKSIMETYGIEIGGKGSKTKLRNSEVNLLGSALNDYNSHVAYHDVKRSASKDEAEVNAKERQILSELDAKEVLVDTIVTPRQERTDNVDNMVFSTQDASTASRNIRAVPLSMKPTSEAKQELYASPIAKSRFNALLTNEDKATTFLAQLLSDNVSLNRTESDLVRDYIKALDTFEQYDNNAILRQLQGSVKELISLGNDINIIQRVENQGSKQTSNENSNRPSNDLQDLQQNVEVLDTELSAEELDAISKRLGLDTLLCN